VQDSILYYWSFDSIHDLIIKYPSLGQHTIYMHSIMILVLESHFCAINHSFDFPTM
jgi:hypothetical protein